MEFKTTKSEFWFTFWSTVYGLALAGLVVFLLYMVMWLLSL